MRNLNSVEFYRVPVGAEFTQNGNRCIKRSTRTADIMNLRAARRFYYGRREIVEVSDTVRAGILAAEREPTVTPRPAFSVRDAIAGKGGAS